MTRSHWTQALLALALGAAGSSHPAPAAEFRCSNGDLERRIELSGPDATPDAVCEVRYWRNANASDSGRVLWHAQQDTDFCAARTRELIARLEAGGWTCRSEEQPALARPAQAAEAGASALNAPTPDAHALEPQASAEGAPAEPSQAVAGAPPALDAPTPDTPALEPETPAAGAPAEPTPAAVAHTERSAAAPAVPPSPNPKAAADPRAAILDQVVEETLHSVEELYGGQLEADPAAFGDLDGDGLTDAAVLITYQPDRRDYVQYLVAYLFNGETFRSVATKNVGGRFLDALRADLQGIADRRIVVELEALDGEATCCATRRAAFALERGQLVEVADPGAPGVERTSQTERPSSG